MSLVWTAGIRRLSSVRTTNRKSSDRNVSAVIYAVWCVRRARSLWQSESRKRSKHSRLEIQMHTEPKKRPERVSFLCGANGNRTSDTRIFSPLLYQLSYGTPEMCLQTKAGAKVLLFFELTKFFCIFFAKACIFLALLAKKQ